MGKREHRELSVPFTPTECRIRDWICMGLDNKAIAGYLHTTEQVIKNMVGRMFNKVGCGNRIEFFLMTHRSQPEIQHDLEIEEVELEQRLVVVRKRLNFIKRGSNTHENQTRTFALSPHPGGPAGALSDLHADRRAAQHSHDLH